MSTFTTQDGMQIYFKDFATPFYGINAGQTTSDGVLTQTLNIALLASLKGTMIV